MRIFTFLLLTGFLATGCFFTGIVKSPKNSAVPSEAEPSGEASESVGGDTEIEGTASTEIEEAESVEDGVDEAVDVETEESAGSLVIIRGRVVPPTTE